LKFKVGQLHGSHTPGKKNPRGRAGELQTCVCVCARACVSPSVCTSSTVTASGRGCADGRLDCLAWSLPSLFILKCCSGGVGSAMGRSGENWPLLASMALVGCQCAANAAGGSERNRLGPWWSAPLQSKGEEGRGRERERECVKGSAAVAVAGCRRWLWAGSPSAQGKNTKQKSGPVRACVRASDSIPSVKTSSSQEISSFFSFFFGRFLFDEFFLVFLVFLFPLPFLAFSLSSLALLLRLPSLWSGLPPLT
jgi:hypothetical protein